MTDLYNEELKELSNSKYSFGSLTVNSLEKSSPLKIGIIYINIRIAVRA